MILNLGCGRKLIKDAVNIDTINYPGVDEVVDLTKFPWKWENNSIDGIHASHVIEHFKDQEQFIWECLRILKPGGFLRLCVPHSSNVASIGCMGHFRTYSYSTLRGYLSEDFYMFGKAKFKTVEQRLNWWYEEIDAQEELPRYIHYIIKTLAPFMNWFVNISPRICENTWIYWIGGCREVVWKGIKL